MTLLVQKPAFAPHITTPGLLWCKAASYRRLGDVRDRGGPARWRRGEGGTSALAAWSRVQFVMLARWLAAAALGVLVCTLGGCSGNAAYSNADLAACHGVYMAFYSTIPPTASLAEAQSTLAALKRANNPALRGLVPGLQTAIRAHNESRWHSIMLGLYETCARHSGESPAT